MKDIKISKDNLYLLVLLLSKYKRSVKHNYNKEYDDLKGYDLYSEIIRIDKLLTYLKEELF